VAALTDRSLITVEGRSGRGESRYRMLETVREFAAEHLDEAEEVEMIRIRHRDYYLVLVETAEPKLVGPDQEHWRGRLFAEQDNLRVAMAFSRERGELEALARMVVALAGFWINSGGVQMSSSSRTPQDASSRRLLYSILRISPPRGTSRHPGLAIQIGYTSERLERSPG